MKLHNHHASCCGFNPERPGGGEWTHVMTLSDGSTVHADSAAEVLGEMLPGYESLDEAARLAARQAHARRMAQQAQQLQLARAAADGGFNPDDPRHAGLIGILTTDKGSWLGLEAPGRPGEPADWVPGIPLVLVTTNYAPHTEHPAIGGNVIWIDPATEDGYLASLHESGLFAYWSA